MNDRMTLQSFLGLLRDNYPNVHRYYKESFVDLWKDLENPSPTETLLGKTAKDLNSELGMDFIDYTPVYEYIEDNIEEINLKINFYRL